MRIEGLVRNIGEIRRFDNKKGEKVASRDIVLESEGRFPEAAVLRLTGKDAEEFNAGIGQKIACSFSFWASEYKGRWFNNLQVWKIER